METFSVTAFYGTNTKAIKAVEKPFRLYKGKVFSLSRLSRPRCIPLRQRKSLPIKFNVWRETFEMPDSSTGRGRQQHFSPVSRLSLSERINLSPKNLSINNCSIYHKIRAASPVEHLRRVKKFLTSRCLPPELPPPSLVNILQLIFPLSLKTFYFFARKNISSRFHDSL